jgi:hypothetical protein
MEKWKWYLLTSSGSVVDKQLTNDITFIKTIILEHEDTKTYVKIYDEATGGTTKEFMTIRNSTAKLNVPIIFDVPAQLENGCYIVPEAAQSDIKVWIQYRNG